MYFLLIVEASPRISSPFSSGVCIIYFFNIETKSRKWRKKLLQNLMCPIQVFPISYFKSKKYVNLIYKQKTESEEKITSLTNGTNVIWKLGLKQ
jgi:hypothetical protein